MAAGPEKQGAQAQAKDTEEIIKARRKGSQKSQEALSFGQNAALLPGSHNHYSLFGNGLKKSQSSRQQPAAVAMRATLSDMCLVCETVSFFFENRKRMIGSN